MHLLNVLILSFLLILLVFRFSAAFPVPTIIETGVASPKAQGQDITKTDIPIESANSNEYPNNSQITVAITAIMITIGTNTPTHFIC